MRSSLPWPAQIAEIFSGWRGRPPEPGHDALVPRLPAGPHWGIIEGFEPLGTTPFDRAGRVEQLMDIAAARGASLSRVQIDWADLETAPGVYDQTLLDSLLAELSARGQHGFVTLGTLDSESLTLPEHLMAEDRLRADLTLDDSSVVSAFAAFLDWLVPQLTQAGVWGLAIGNEVEFPVEEGIVTEAEAEGFLLAGLAHVQSLDPDLAATVTLSTQASTITPTLTQSLADASDIFSVNFYGDGGAAGPTVQSWSEGLDHIRDSANGKPIFFQELGMPVGYAAAGLQPQSGIEGSLETQQDFFAFMGQEIARDPQLIGATVFQLLDWSPDFTADYLGSVANGDLPDFFSLYAETLETIGLAAWADGRTRPAWDTWLHTVDAAGAVRDLMDRSAIFGSAGADALTVTGRDALVFARAGNDTVTSGQGRDAIDLGRGADVAHLGRGDDIALGRRGSDSINAGGGNDWVLGGGGRDALLGARGADTLRGGNGDDLLNGGRGGDELFGQSGRDHLLGGKGHDRLRGGGGDDTLEGQRGNDWLNGGAGNDWMKGGAGNDRLFGQSGADVLIGGRGSDTFVFHRGSDYDYVSDFDPAEDQIELSCALFGGQSPDELELAERITFADGTAFLDFGEGDVLELQGVETLETLWPALLLI